MVYFMKKTKNSKGVYLQIYESHYVPEKNGKRNYSHKSIGYVDDLIKKGIPDPYRYVQDMVDALNANLLSSNPQIQNVSACKNVGYFLIKSMFDFLHLDDDIKLMTSNKKVQYCFANFIRAMTYAQIVSPGSKHKAFEKVIPNLFGVDTFTYDQILDGINYIGHDYTKFIELLNQHIFKVYPRNLDSVFFDCTNYYFEIDLCVDDKQKGYSKENRRDPIIGQALLLDGNQIPIAMKMYPGNKSEKPYIRETIADIKERYDINNKIVQVADKGLNCARNIYAAAVESNDGYIFSKSIHGTGLSRIEKDWLILENSSNIWVTVRDEKDNICYKYKECVDEFEYDFEDDEDNKVSFIVEEKRIVTYNPSLAKKKIMEINKEVKKAEKMMSIKQASKEDFGDSVKYVNFESIDKEGKKIKPIAKLNHKKIDEDIKLAGYNLIVTSEKEFSAQQIYNTYHGLWKIENSFRILKTYLEARPVFLQQKESIYGHFLICYYALTILRLLEVYVFNYKLSSEQIVEFIRDYNVSKSRDNSYVNNAISSTKTEVVKKVYGTRKLGNLYLSKKDIEFILSSEIYNNKE